MGFPGPGGQPSPAPRLASVSHAIGPPNAIIKCLRSIELSEAKCSGSHSWLLGGTNYLGFIEPSQSRKANEFP